MQSIAKPKPIDGFRHIKSQPKPWKNLTKRLCGTTTAEVKSIVLGLILIYRNWSIAFSSQRPCFFWSSPRIAIHKLPVTQPMQRVKSDKSDWLKIRNLYSAHAQSSWLLSCVDQKECGHWIQCDALEHVFSLLAPATCIYYELWLVHWIY